MTYETRNWFVWVITVLCLLALMMLSACMFPTLEWKYQYCLKHAHEYQQQYDCYREYNYTPAHQAPLLFYDPVPFGYAYPPTPQTGIIVGPHGEIWIDTGSFIAGPEGSYLDLRN